MNKGCKGLWQIQKRTVATCFTFFGYSIAQTIAQGPQYTAGFAATSTMTALGAILAQLLRLYYKRQNSKRDKAGEFSTIRGKEDITDWENKGFRYQL
ncbi:hypothetical protein EMMF5_006159 [Cystobasidiomycetes sp. EMM_F5]